MTCPNCGNEVAASLKFCSKCGTPMSAPQPSAPANYAQPSWSPAPQYGAAPPRRKSNVGKILLIVGIIIVLLAAGIGTAIFFGVRSYMRTIRSSEPYALAESTLKESPIVKERFGEIKDIGVPLGTYKEEPDGSGYAAFTMSVVGVKLSGQYVATLIRRKGIWHIERAMIKLPAGEEVEIYNETEFGRTYPADETNTNQDQNGAPINSNSPDGKSKTISGGVLNGKAINLPKPAYPASAKAARASGTVVVQVTIDEQGKVVSATAVSGHPLLQASAVAAARQATFTPTKLSGKAVRVTGTINYNFTLEE